MTDDSLGTGVNVRKCPKTNFCKALKVHLSQVFEKGLSGLCVNAIHTTKKEDIWFCQSHGHFIGNYVTLAVMLACSWI